MAGSSPKIAESGKKKARIEIIPLIDVIFFLLATFVLFTLSLDKIAGMPVNLPKAVDSPTNAKPDETMLSIQVSEPGSIYWRVGPFGAPEVLTPNEIRPRLQDYKTRYSPARVLVRGDTRSKFGDAVFILDEVRMAGIDQVSVETVTSSTGK